MPEEPAHPRSRGENEHITDYCQISAGSSPLTRGKPAWAAYQAGGVRLIPAHAGKTWFALIGQTAWWAHPRSRGENRVAVYEVTATSGSSPLTRRKR